MNKCLDCSCIISSYSKRCQPCYHVFRSGSNHPLYGLKREDKVRRKISNKLTGRPSTSSTKFKKGHVPWIKDHGHLFTGERATNWKGGRISKKTGYIMLRMPNHPTADSQGYILEHRYVMEQKIGRLLKTQEQVHHINHIKTDNRPENLMLFDSVSSHRLFECHINSASKQRAEKL